jgi:hypothetical protein
MTTSVSGHTLYAVIKKNDEYSISACGFICSTTPTNYIFQMLKDTHFSNICSDDEDLNIEIIAIKSLGTNTANKLAILDYLNNDKALNDNIKSILKFYSQHIKSNIVDNMLVIKNSTSHTEFKSIINKNLETTELNNVYNCMQNVEIHLLVHNYNKQLYISNPSFSIDKNSMNYLLVK